jgi:acylphosphatase
MLEMKLIVHGRVQGVGYRHSIIQHIENEQSMARGYVWNKPNGTVEIVAQGTIEELKDIRRFSVTGSNTSEVRQVEETIDEISEYSFDSFDIRY